jgi:hypothetical protein
MKQAQLERYIALFLFVTVLIAFSYAEEESKKIQKLYTKDTPAKDTQIALKVALAPYTPY